MQAACHIGDRGSDARSFGPSWGREYRRVISSPSRDETVAFDPAALRNGALSEPPVGKYKEVHVSEPDQYGSEVEPLLLEYAEMVYPRWSEAIRPKDYLNGNPCRLWMTCDIQRCCNFSNQTRC